MRGDAAKALARYENMPTFGICWNRRRFRWRRRNPENAPLFIEAILLERVPLDGRPQLEIVARLATIDEDRADEAAGRDLFWRETRCKLGKLRRLTPRDICWQSGFRSRKTGCRRNRRPFARARTRHRPAPDTSRAVMHQARSARLASALFRRLPTSTRPTSELACECYKLLVGLDFKFFPDPLPLRRDALLSVTEFQSNFLVCLPACESPQQLLLARAY